MTRSILGIGLAIVSLALLGALVFQSRPVPVDVHIAHHAAIADLERTAEDFESLVATLNAAWTNVQYSGEGALALMSRVTSSTERLSSQLFRIRGSSSQESRVRNRFEGYVMTVEQMEVLLAELLVEQAAFVDSANFIREGGPAIVEQMREIRLDRAASDTFQLVVGTLDFVSTGNGAQDAELRRLLVSLGRDQRIDANMPGQAQRLLDAVALILNNKRIIQSRVTEISGTPIVENAYTLIEAAEDLYRGTLESVDQARMLLSIYAMLLFVAAGFIAFRLNQSYRQLNQANGDLATMNLSLERRVAERTNELVGTLENLKDSQVQLVQAEKMSSLGQLVAGISHEINTPLLYLANNSELIQERLDTMEKFVKRSTEVFGLKAENYVDRKEFQREFLASLTDLKKILREDEVEAGIEEARDLMLDSIEGLKELTEMAQSLKDFSRLDRSPIDNFDVNSGLEKSLLIARNALKHTATIHKSYGEIPEIECSPSQVNQIFLNIITNAAQAVDDNGEINISTKRHDAGHVAITIADNGCGIPEENLNRIRDPFFTTKEVGTGTGLGLSIVDEIIRSHHGELVIESEAGKGSSFTIILPISNTQAAGEKGMADAEDVDELAEAS